MIFLEFFDFYMMASFSCIHWVSNRFYNFSEKMSKFFTIKSPEQFEVHYINVRVHWQYTVNTCQSPAISSTLSTHGVLRSWLLSHIIDPPRDPLDTVSGVRRTSPSLQSKQFTFRSKTFAYNTTIEETSLNARAVAHDTWIWSGELEFIVVC